MKKQHNSIRLKKITLSNLSKTKQQQLHGGISPVEPLSKNICSPLCMETYHRPNCEPFQYDN